MKKENDSKKFLSEILIYLCTIQMMLQFIQLLIGITFKEKQEETPIMMFGYQMVDPKKILLD